MPFHRVSTNRRLFSFAWPFIAALALLLLLGAVTQSMMSSVRAYLVGETLWSKGQKDAIFALDRYADNGALDAYLDYQNAIRVPLGDRRARLALQQDPPDLKTAAEGLLQGDNDPSDIPGAIWLFQHFHDQQPMEQAIYYWTEADRLLMQLEQLARELHTKREAGTLSNSELAEIRQRIYYINLQATPLGKAFSITLAEGAREVQHTLLLINLAAAAALIALALLRTRQLIRQNERFEDALAQSEERLKLAVSGSDYGIWDWDIANDSVYCSPRMRAMLELAEGEQIDTLEAFTSRLHPADLAATLEALNRHLSGSAGYDVEYRLRTHSGGYRWLRSRGQALYDDHGQPIRMSGSVFDISDRKAAENALYAEKERAQITLASIGDAVITTDTDGRIEYLNPVAERLTGCSSEQARGQALEALFRLLDPNQPEQQLLPLGNTAPDTGSSLQLLRNDGSQVAVSMVSAPIFDHANNSAGLVLVFHDMTREHQYIANLSWQATHDELTGIANRHEFELRLGQLLDGASYRNQHHALMYLDLDQFKVVNDTCGHAAGDELLRQVCVLLQQHLRDDDMLARLGGDEFGVLLKNCPPEAVVQVADKLRQTVHDLHFVWGSQPFSVSVSIGVVHISGTPTTLKEVLRAADVACYLAKEKGRNRVQVYSPGDAELTLRYGELEWVQRLHRALEEDRFCLYAQPIQALAAGSTPEFHFELLLRLRDENGALVPPIAFIPAAERYNLMAQIDRWVVHHTFRTLSTLGEHSAQPEHWQCAINLSGASIGDEAFLEFLQQALLSHDIAPQRLCFEITETSAIANLASATRFIRELKKLGCRFSLDDFGAGMSSFGYLKHLPVDYLKIDGGFVKDMLDDPIDRAMVEMINHIGHVMGKRTIAEFVENQAIVEELKKIGVDYAQGYGVAQPQPLPEILAQAFGTPRQLVEALPPGSSL